MDIIQEISNSTGVTYSEEQRKILEHKGGTCILACAGSGKALVNGTKVLTTNGYVPIEELKLGDSVFDEKGKMCYVIGVYPQGNKEVYEVTFENEKVIRCCDEHLWGVYDSEGVYSVLSVKDIIKSGKKFSIPVVPPIRFSNRANVKNGSVPEILNRLEIARDAEISMRLSGGDFMLCATDDVADELENLCELSGYIVYRENWKDTRTKKLTIKKQNFLKIKSIERVADNMPETESYQLPMTCIKVSSQSELFLTEHCIVTHNTTVLTHLICKRIMTGEIEDTSKLLLTTYSKAGSIEMEKRLSSLFDKVGLRCKVDVRTMHSLYYKVLKRFNVFSNVCSEAQRGYMISKAISNLGMKLEQEDINDIDSLISFQVNNIMTDEQLATSYAFNAVDIGIEEFRAIREGYAKQKQEKGVIDFDDMQLYMYMLLVTQKNETVINYCRDNWNYFVIDEFQDISKIQFEILRVMVTDSNKLVVIGDDDQCIVEGSKVLTEYGYKNIEDVECYDYILTGVGRGKTQYLAVDNISKKRIQGKVVKIVTKTGKEIKGTPEHIGFARLNNKEFIGNSKEGVCEISYSMLDSMQTNDVGIHKSKIEFKSYSDKYTDILNSYDTGRLESNNIDEQEKIIKNIVKECSDAGIYLEVNREIRLNDNKYMMLPLSNIVESMLIPVLDENGNIIDDEVISVSLEDYDGYVYDLSVSGTRNFLVNDIFVHNCIYQWRGADPSIILNIGGYYNIDKFILSTNYRCTGEIVNKAAIGIKNNTKRVDKNMIPFRDGGKVKVINSTNSMLKMSEDAYKYIKSLTDKGVDYGDIAVLVKNNKQARILHSMLMKDSIYCSVSNKDMKFTENQVAKDLIDLASLVDNTYDHNVVSRVLWKLGSYMKADAARRLSKLIQDTGYSFYDALGYWLSINGVIGEEVAQGMNVPKAVKNRLWGTLVGNCANDMYNLYNILNNSDSKERAYIDIVDKYCDMYAYAFKTSDALRCFMGACSYMQGLVEELGFDDMIRFIYISQNLNAEDDNLPSLNNRITLSTMHGAKGREWEYVILLANDNISIPSFEGIETMITKGISIQDAYAYLDEDRRLNYVAWTRAKKELVLITSSKDMSVYSMENFNILENGKNNENILWFARRGALPSDVIDAVEKVVFDKERGYLLEV